MAQAMEFAAPWSSRLQLSSAFVVAILLTMFVAGLTDIDKRGLVPALILLLVPVVIALVTARYAVRGYRVEDGVLIVHRLGWDTNVSLADLVSIEADPAAMSRSNRVWGNGGAFSYVGSFRNKKLGAYRAYATDKTRAVVLRFAERAIVVTPDNPAAFVAQVKEAAKMAGASLRSG